MSKGRARTEARKLDIMLKDLQALKSELLPDERDKARAEEMKSFDDFQRKKHALRTLLDEAHEDLNRLDELKRSLGRDNERNTQTIRLRTDIEDRLRDGEQLFQELRQQLDKDAQKTGRKKLDDAKLNDRRQLVILLGEEMKSLATQVSRHGHVQTKLEEQIEARADWRNRKDAEARERRERLKKDRKLKRGEVNINEEDFKNIAPMSEQEQAFEEKVNVNYRAQDEIIKQISAGLDELKELANEANKHLTIQKAMLDQVDEKMDTTISSLKTANRRLQSILDETGGMSRWCPMVLCLIILIALIGYVVNT